MESYKYHSSNYLVLIATYYFTKRSEVYAIPNQQLSTIADIIPNQQTSTIANIIILDISFVVMESL